MKSTWRILVIDDEAVMRESLAAWLREDGYEVNTAASGRDGIDRARETDYAIYFVDLKMPGGIDGIETMMEVKKLRPAASIVIITAYATVDTAITAMKEGALEYIVKPCNPQEISLLVTRIIKVKKLERENEILRRRLSGRWHFHDLLSRNSRMQEVFALVKDVASLKSTVLVTGESGTGKELVARALHFSGERAGKPFVGVSCAALSESLLESELFGHEKGAFTGAAERRKGKFELAEGGTIFLDEIGDISPKVQVDLLRVLQERRFFRVGGSEEVSVDVRVVAATHVDLADAVRQGCFREDLFYRLNVVAIHLPPLRERPEDVPLLARAFVERLAQELGKEAEDLSEGALKALLAHRWPGNVRELENAVERALVTAKGRVLTEEDFAFLKPASEAAPGWTVPTHLPLAEVEKSVIGATLRRNEGNVKETATVLGIDRSTLYDKLKRYGIERS
jgi:DNA-binding NtrC family response regulator